MHTVARLLLAALVSFAVSCGKDSPTSPSAQTLAGTWNATRAEFVNAANSGQRVEIVAMGTTLTLTLDSPGTYTQKITDPGHAGQTTTGTWSASKDVLTLKPSNTSGNTQFDMTFDGNSLSLSGGHVTFDFNDDGLNEEALAYLTLVRGQA